jgi:Fe-S cluster biosynthesis and repair protein YggX
LRANEKHATPDDMISVIHKQTLQINCLKDILQQNKNYPARMSSDDVAIINEEMNKTVDLICNILDSMDDVILKKKNDIAHRKPHSENCLLFCQILKKYYDNNDASSTNTFEKELKKPSVLTLTVYANESCYHGMDSRSIKNQEVQQKYEEELSSESQSVWTFRLQWHVKQSLTDALKKTSKILEEIYSISPIVDDELVELLDKYEYPEEERAKIFKALNIPYKGFREWQTNDGLLTLTAKLIFADKKEVKIEKEDGKQFTIEIAYLRKEDQDYVKRQLDSKTKTPKTEKTKD